MGATAGLVPVGFINNQGRPQSAHPARVTAAHCWGYMAKQQISMSWTAPAVLSITVGRDTLTFDVAKASKECTVMALRHGWEARILDKAALGKDATVEMKRDAMAGLIRHYESGTTEWRLERAGGARGPSPTVAFLVRAFTGYVDSSGNTWTAEYALQFFQAKGAAACHQIATDRTSKVWSVVAAQLAKDEKAAPAKDVMQGF